ncbi:MAG: glycosyltransferase, partial [Pseudomonadota bacterium]
MDVSLVIPAYNEENRLPSTVEAVMEYIDASPLRIELIIVDDGSSDGTRGIIEAAADGREWISAVLCDANRGKGAAVREGFAKAKGEVVVFFDADLSYPLDLIEAAEGRIREGADLVIGGRDLTGKDSRWRYSPVRRMATTLFNVIVEQLLSLGIPDTQCGFKAFRRDVTAAMFEKLTIDSFAF